LADSSNLLFIVFFSFCLLLVYLEERIFRLPAVNTAKDFLEQNC